MITPDFSRGQTLGEPSEINLVDTSTGSDSQSITKRRVYITDKDGNYYTEAGVSATEVYSEWNGYPGTTTLTLDVLTQDRAVNLKVDWLTAANAVVQSVTKLSDFTLYAKTYFFFLCKSQSSNTTLRNRANFYQNYIKLLVSIKEADDSVTLLADISSSQAALNRAKALISSPSNFF